MSKLLMLFHEHDILIVRIMFRIVQYRSELSEHRTRVLNAKG